MPQSTMVVEGSAVTLRCAFAISSFSRLTVSWTKDGNMYTLPGSNLTLGNGLATYNLEFSSIKYQQGGVYQCTARSDFLDMTRSSPDTKVIIFGK